MTTNHERLIAYIVVLTAVGIGYMFGNLAGWIVQKARYEPIVDQQSQTIVDLQAQLDKKDAAAGVTKKQPKVQSL
jgi:hypothetical protein